MKLLIAELEKWLEVYETNQPIHRTGGEHEQADLEAWLISQIRMALRAFKGAKEGR